MPASSSFPHRHLLGIRGLTRDDITRLLDLAETFLKPEGDRDFRRVGGSLVTLFFEPSTRTRASFELAAHRLGMNVVTLQADQSSVSKGESLKDTGTTLEAMRPDFLVVRHPESGAAAMLAEQMQCAVINAGDGCHEHPTQALLDALTLRRRLGRLEGLTVAICGDILHSRVARSNILLLRTMGAHVRLAGPPTLVPPHLAALGAEIMPDMREAISGADAVIVLRLQKERMGSRGGYVPSEREYAERYGLDHALLSCASPGAPVLHPGPVNRGLELTDALAEDGTRNAILDQVATGVALRQAVLALMAGTSRIPL